MHLGICLERIACVFCPTLVYEDVPHAVASCEINEVLVCVEVDAGLECYIRSEGNAVEPVPTSLSDLNPIGVSDGICRSETDWHSALDQLSVVLRDEHIAPGESASALCLGNIVGFFEDVMAAVASVLVFERAFWLDDREGVGAFADGFEEDACIVEQVELGDEDFLLFAHDEDGQLAHLVVGFPGIAFYDGVVLFAACLEAVRLLQDKFCGSGELPSSVLAHHFDVAFQGCDEAIGHAIVIDTPLNLVVPAKGKREQSIVVLDLVELEGMDRRDSLVDLCNLVALEDGLFAEGTVAESHADVVLLEQLFAMAFYVVVDAIGEGYSYFCLSIRTRCADFLLRVGG